MRYNFIAMSALSQAIAALIRALFAAAVLVALSAPSLAQENGSRPATEKDIQRVEEDIRRLEEDIQRLEEAGKRRDAKLDELTVNMAALSKNMAVLAKEVELQGKRMDMLGKRMDDMRNTLNNILYAIIAGLFVLVAGLFGAPLLRREPKSTASAVASQSLSTPPPTKPNVAIALVTTDEMFAQLMETPSFQPGRKPPPILTSGGGPND